jgi:hypothetical protein
MADASFCQFYREDRDYIEYERVAAIARALLSDMNTPEVSRKIAIANQKGV